MSDPQDAFQQAAYRVRFDWGPVAAGRLAGCSDVVVVVDVLSFSTGVEIAVGRGAVVVPVRWGDSRAVEAEVDRGAIHAVARGSRDARQPWSMAPSSLISVPARTRVVMPSPNGASIAAAIAGQGSTVLAGCLRNATAVARAAAALGGTVAVIAAGERWPDGSLRPSLEDLVGAGMILGRLAGEGAEPLSPEALAAVSVATAITDHRSLLRECVSGRELIASGFDRDIELAAAVDVSTAVPLLREGAFIDRR